jgi:hypothetical protein
VRKIKHFGIIISDISPLWYASMISRSSKGMLRDYLLSGLVALDVLMLEFSIYRAWQKFCS